MSSFGSSSTSSEDAARSEEVLLSGPEVVVSSPSSLGGDGEGDSQEERIALLRKRGVLIEIPEQNKCLEWQNWCCSYIQLTSQDLVNVSKVPIEVGASRCKEKPKKNA